MFPMQAACRPGWRAADPARRAATSGTRAKVLIHLKRFQEVNDPFLSGSAHAVLNFHRLKLGHFKFIVKNRKRPLALTKWWCT